MTRLPHDQMHVELTKMAVAKIDWLQRFSDGRDKRPDHEIETKRRELAVLQQAKDDYQARGGESRMKISFQRFGDFYESFGDEARIVATVCGMALTKRRSDNMPMCGVPAHSSADRFAELRAAGHEVEALNGGDNR